MSWQDLQITGSKHTCQLCYLASKTPNWKVDKRRVLCSVTATFSDCYMMLGKSLLEVSFPSFSGLDQQVAKYKFMDWILITVHFCTVAATDENIFQMCYRLRNWRQVRRPTISWLLVSSGHSIIFVLLLPNSYFRARFFKKENCMNNRLSSEVQQTVAIY